MWSPGGLIAGAEARLEAELGHADATTLVTGTAWLSDATGGPVPPPGFGFPIDVAYIEPDEYRRVTGHNATGLGERTVVFSETGQRTRERHLRVTLDGTSYRRTAVITDEAALGYEAMLAAPAPRTWDASFLLVRTQAPAVAVRDGAAGLSDRPIAVIREGDAPYLRYAHSTSPQARFKEVLGEFAARPLPDGTVAIDPRWVAGNIVERPVPLLGNVRCHRDLLAQLRLALTEIRRAGSAAEVHPEQYAGCFSPRFIGRDPAGRLSAHAWGAAVDVNAAENPLGRTPAMDPAVVNAFRAAGFNWGGEWLVPDGMHFEWARELGA